MFGRTLMLLVFTGSILRPSVLPGQTNSSLQGTLRPIWRYPLPEDPRFQRGVTCGNLDGNGKPRIIVGGHAGAVILDQAGHHLRTVPVGRDMDFLALAHAPKGTFLFGFGTWSQDIEARDPSGKKLWSYPTPDGVDWACPVTTGQSGGDAIAIGCNGRGGMHLVNADGTRRWRAVEGLGNVWSVAAARLDKGRSPSILCVGDNTIDVFDLAGKRVRDIKPEPDNGTWLDVGALYAADLDNTGVDDVLALGTTVVSGGYLWVFDAKGKLRWHRKASNGFAAVEGPIVVGRFWPAPGGKRQIAVGRSDGTVFLFDSEGHPLPTLKTGRVLTSLAALPRSRSATDGLVIVTPEGVICYEWRKR